MFVTVVFSRPYWRSRLCYSVASVLAVVRLSVCDVMYCG